MTLVVLNPNAHGGQARARWQRVAHLVEGAVTEADCRGAVARGCRSFIAAGGDGTVNAVLNAIVECKGGRPLEEFTLGAVGLGSSNDFHKPFQRVVGGIPLRIDAAGGALRDVGIVRWGDHARCFLLGVSFGTAARGNALFNRNDGWLKRHWTGGAIAYAALRAIAEHRNVEAKEQEAFASLSVMKSQYLSGSFRFDTPVAPDDGLFAVNICGAMGRLGLLRVLYNLQHGRFAGATRRAASVTIETEAPIPAEIDGEIVEGSRFEITLLPERIRVCG